VGIPPEFIARIETAHEKQRQAALAVLNAEAAQEDARDAMQHEQVLLLQLLEKKLLAGTQGSAWKGSDRLRWLLTAVAEVKGLTVETSGDPAAAKSAVFREALAKFRRETSSRQTAAIEDAQKRWETCVAGLYKIAAQENAKREGLATFIQARAELDLALEEYRRAPAPAATQDIRRRILSPANLPYGWVFGCWVLAFWLLRPFFRARQNISMASIERLSACVDAAAAGDLSRLAQVSSETGLERLAYGLIRLSAVCMRSENLVHHLAALVEASGEAIVSQNLEGKILSWNKGAQRLYGYTVEDVRGQSIGILSPLDQGSQLRSILERVKSGEKVGSFEALHQAKNGRVVRAFVKVSAIYDSVRQVIGVSFCAQELSASVNPDALPLIDTLQRS
jgi:PAS domain S-box-containing protein